MQNRDTLFGVGFILFCATVAWASVFGDARGVVRDPQHQPIKGATVTIHSRSSEFSQTMQTDGNGQFVFRTIPIGDYFITIEASGFSAAKQPYTVVSDNAPLLQFQLQIAPEVQSVEVVATPEIVGSESPTPTTLVSRELIDKTPGADRSNSLSSITNYVPGAYLTHDQLHVRGGHQVTYLIDGVPVANTNISSNVGPQLDPKDIDYLETQRGSYSAEFGDRTYGIFNIVPRSGFEGINEGELRVSYGNFHQTSDHISFASHTKRFAYYASINGSRSDFGLEAPVAVVLHDQTSGFGGFASFIYNATPNDQLRLVTSLRGDHYQVPNDGDRQSRGIRDINRERDAFINFSWVHTAGPEALLTISPFYHFNRADFVGGAGDTPIIPRDNRSSQYAGAQIVFSALTRRHNIRAGVYGFYQRDNNLFGLQATDGSGLSLQQREKGSGNLEAIFLEDQYKPISWLILTGGVRFTHFDGRLSENVASPRVGTAIRIPHLNWIVRGFYGRFYQAPPLSTVSGPLLNLAIDNGFGFLPLRGERDEEYQAGVTIPLKGWTLDTDYFHTAVKNLFDHNTLANSNIFFPITIDRGHIKGFELTLRSPKLLKRGEVYLVYSRQRAEGQGAVNGGLTDFSPSEGYFFLDHDQRNTLNVGLNLSLPKRGFLAAVMHYGSGFLDGDGNGSQHLPGHTTFDLSIGKPFGESWSVTLNMVNGADKRFLLDNSNTFGGTHFVEPRQIYVELCYRFHY